MNSKAAHLSHSLRVDLKGAAANKPAAGVGNEEGRYAGEILLDQLVGKQSDQTADGRHIALTGGTNLNTGRFWTTWKSAWHPSIVSKLAFSDIELRRSTLVSASRTADYPHNCRSGVAPREGFLRE